MNGKHWPIWVAVIGMIFIGPLSWEYASAQDVAGDPPSANLAKKAYDAVLPSTVEVRIHIKEDRTTPAEERNSLDRWFDQFVTKRAPLRVAGFRVSPEGAVLVRDPNLPLERYGDIEIVHAFEQSVPARIGAILKNYAGVLIEPIEPPDPPLPYVQFIEPDVAPGDTLLVVTPAFLEKMLSLEVQIAHAAATAIQEADPPTTLLWWEPFNMDSFIGSALGSNVRTTVPIILDDRGRVLGLALDNALWRTGTGDDSWIGPKIMADERLAPAALETIGEQILANASGAIKNVEIQFRKDSRITEQFRGQEPKLYLYGALVDDRGGIFVPTVFDRDTVQQIESITVRDGDQTAKATFEGLYRDLGAFLIRVEGVSGTARIVEKDVGLPRGKVFFTLSVRRRYGRRYEQVEYNRYLDVASGYKEVHYPVAMKPLRVGDLIADEDGALLGFYAPMRKEEQDEIRAKTGDSYGREDSSRIYLFSEIAEILKKPEGQFDTAARPMTRREQHATAWLGVEYQKLDAPLARALGVEGPTRGGGRGLLVTEVYPNSPAAQLKIEIGNILLAIEVPRPDGQVATIDLAQPVRSAFRGSGTPLPQRSARLWRSRKNYLTAVLTLLGEDRDIVLHLFRNGEVEKIPFTIAKAPDDFDNAVRYTDEALGLTVAEITYEVRSVLRLKESAPGVVVSDVEPGSKAAIARIGPYELITRVNSKPVSSPKEYEDLVTAARQEERIELLVEELGNSRIVELDIEPEEF